MELRRTARGIIIHKDMILLIERWRDNLHYFSIPGGGIEEGESSKEALKRELLEETGVQVAIQQLAFIMQTPDSIHEIFLCHYVSGEPQLAADAPERLGGPRNRFEPAWQLLSEWSTLPLIYWEPMRQPLTKALKDGFPPEPVIVPVGTSR